MEQSLPKKRGRPKGSKNKPNKKVPKIDASVPLRIKKNTPQHHILSDVRTYLRYKGDYVHSNQAIHIIMGKKRTLPEIAADCKSHLGVEIEIID